MYLKDILSDEQYDRQNFLSGKELYEAVKRHRDIISKATLTYQIGRYFKGVPAPLRAKGLLGVPFSSPRPTKPDIEDIEKKLAKRDTSLETLNTVFLSLIEELKESKSDFHKIVMKPVYAGTICSDIYAVISKTVTSQKTHRVESIFDKKYVVFPVDEQLFKMKPVGKTTNRCLSVLYNAGSIGLSPFALNGTHFEKPEYAYLPAELFGKSIKKSKVYTIT
ncbi:MAG: hypothetical protein KAT91_01375 [Candidatus Aenigmarchaeota archaeon]|nr:hypothetical protein [Candidatus Aenigmarchaeota archaeon]